MTGSQRMTAIVLAAAMVIGGFAFGRLSDTPRTSALEQPAAPNQFAPNQPNQPQTQAQAAREDQAFYLSDYKVGYNDGFAAVRGKQTSALPNTTREGYNEGFKQGYADAYQAQAQPQSLQPAPTQTRYLRQPVYSSYPVRRRGSSKLKTALTIAAPAALGAGIGVAAGGKKGAAIGALVGGGGGALYHLFKNRDRD